MKRCFFYEKKTSKKIYTIEQKNDLTIYLYNKEHRTLIVIKNIGDIVGHLQKIRGKSVIQKNTINKNQLFIIK